MDAKQIKEILSLFVTESLNASRLVGLRDGTEVKLNKAVYEIQHHLTKELEDTNINTKLDEHIFSESILRSFSSPDYTHYKSEYYAFPFLKHLHQNFRVDQDLLIYIDNFIEVIKEKLSWRDIVITKTGATRCKTNIRFALNHLREMQLVRKRNAKDKRTLLPTVIGQLLVHYFDWINGKHPGSVRLEDHISFHGYAHFTSHLERLKDPIVLIEFLSYIKGKFSLEADDFSKIEKYMADFTIIILSAMTISEKGIKYDAGLKTTKEYKVLLSELNNDYMVLRSE